MARQERYTTRQVISALQLAKGIKADAARALGCNRHTVDNYIKRHPTVQRAYQDLRETMVDKAEVGLNNLVEQGDWQAIKYTLSTLGKDRGYTERREVSFGDGDLDAAIEAELARLAAGRKAEVAGTTAEAGSGGDVA